MGWEGCAQCDAASTQCLTLHTTQRVTAKAHVSHWRLLRMSLFSWWTVNGSRMAITTCDGASLFLLMDTRLCLSYIDPRSTL